MCFSRGRGQMEDKTVINLAPNEDFNNENANEIPPQVGPRKWLNVLKKVAILTVVSLVAIYLCALVILYPMQKTFMYIPDKHSHDEPLPDILSKLQRQEVHQEDDNLDWHWKEEKIVTSDKETLSCYWVRHFVEDPQTIQEFRGKELFTVIYFHGRSGSIHRWVPVVKTLMSKVRCNVLMVSYRGYGRSTGSPDEEGMKLDAQAALDWTLTKLSKEEDKERLVVYGQSMGGAVAIHLAAQNPDTVKHLIVENTFLSLPQVASQVTIWFALFLPFIHQIWDSASEIKKVTCKILFLSSAKDKFIPPSQMVELSKLATSAESTTFVSIPNRGHNNAYKDDGYPAAIETFLYGNK